MRCLAVPAVLVAAAVLAAGGCEPSVRAEREAAADDLAVTLEPVGTQPEGGLPAEVRVGVTNRSGVAVAFVPPRPLVPVSAEGAEQGPPLPCLALVLEDAAGHDEMPVWTDPGAGRLPKADRVVLAPGRAWTRTCAIDAFYFWGPSGPDARGGFARYFWRGDRPVRMRARLLLAGGRQVDSEPVALRCRWEDWLFREDHDG